MATTKPPLALAELTLKGILENLGIAPIVLDNWRIIVEHEMPTWRYRVIMSWRDYRLYHSIDANDMRSFSTAQLLITGKAIASQLRIFNNAKDEEHMEALVLIARGPTNGIHHQ